MGEMTANSYVCPDCEMEVVQAEDVAKLIETARAAENEACARIADALGNSISDHEAGAALNIAAAIRARINKD